MKKLSLLAAIALTLLVTWSLAQPTPQSGWANAQWIWDEPDAHKTPQNNEPRYLRLNFTLDAKPSAAELWATADNTYVAYVNGQKVGDGNEWASVQKYDVAKHLVVGKNVVAIKATNQGGVAGAIARLHVKTADKKDVFIVTGDKTKVARSLSKGWINADFDDSSWFNAIVLGDTSIGPWNVAGGAVAQKGKGKGKKAAGPFGYDTNETVPIKGRLTPQEQIKHFVVPKDFTIELVAADPVIINPITMVMDDKGRIIVSESHTYRYGPPGSPIKPYANPVVRLDPDGKGGFTRTLIADGFADPVMGIAVKGDKLWLAANNYLYTYDLPESPQKGAGANFLPSPPVLRGRGAGGEGAALATTASLSLRPENATSLNVQAPSPPAPLPLSTGGEGSKKPLAINKKTIVTDLNKAWNPFGMFVLEWGPDGKLYMSVGNHNISLQGPDKDKTSGRGGSGIVVRMNPDGSKMERLVHGLRVPYSFEMDPFGQLWVLSNGEGNPNRFVRVIEGVDYHCYSRGAVDNNWLAGNHPLAPPSEELHRGAHTQLMRYYGAAYPAEYQGNVLLCNWGAHGYAGPNRAINRFVLDDRNNVVKREPLVWCKDPHFRPAHIMYDTDGSILIADWYGRDDESDMTGRIWRLKYVGKDAPVVTHKLDAPEWKDDKYAISALGSPSHLVREKAMETLVKSGTKVVEKTAKLAQKFDEPLGAANAIWVLSRIGGDKAPLGIVGVGNHPNWKVKRLALTALHPFIPATKKERENEVGEFGIAFGNAFHFGNKQGDPAVSLELERFYTGAAELDKDDLGRLSFSGLCANPKLAADPHLRYEAARQLAKHADAASLTKLLASDDANIRLAGLIAIDVACYENFPSKKAALEALAKALENPGKLDQQLLLDVARLDGDASIVPALEKLIARDDLPTATIAKAVLVLKAKAGGSLTSAKLSAAAGKRLIEAVEKGSLKIASPADQLVIFEFLESEGPTPFALKQIAGQLQSNNKELRQAAHVLARRFGPKASSLTDSLWPSVLNPKTKFGDAIDYLSTIARVETPANQANWRKLLSHSDPLVRAETVRWWRSYKGQPDQMQALFLAEEFLLKADPSIREDFDIVKLHLEGRSTPPAVDKGALTKYAADELTKIPAGERTKRAAMGLQVFERNACTKCHTTATATTPLAPSLKGIAAQKIDYLIESVLYPSKIIKTGFESEIIELKNGKTLTGLVKDEGKHYRVLGLDKNELIAKTEVESRNVSKISVMPDGQEATMSRREFVDLIAYMQTLK
jgi:putative heme-binding domain-containing protein